MFDMGFQEIVLIGVIALIVIGPERLPSVARSVGLWVGKIQRFVAGVKSDIANELKTDELRNMLSSQEDQIRELKSMVKETQSDLERTAKDAKRSVNEGMDGAVAQVKEAAEAASRNNSKMQDIASAAGYNTYDNLDKQSSAADEDQSLGENTAAGDDVLDGAAQVDHDTPDNSSSKDQDSSQSA